jgi:mRNA deadenylase 3'-5' endonuclease subunit Ccr4
MVRVMSYNILADQLAHAHRAELYAAVPAPLLHWPTRMSALVRSPIPN